MIRTLLFLTALLAAAPAAAQGWTPDVIYVPTPHEVVDDMLRLVDVKKGDILYDLGSGDGRIPIAAAKKYGIRATGIDIDPERIAEANQKARGAGVSKLVEFRQEDLFKANFRDATVVTLYLLPDLNLRLRPRLWAELKPGTRVVSHQFDMGDWQPDKKQGEIEARIEWLPFQLNPEMPAEGVVRADYRRAKFGSVEKGRALDARVAQEGAGEGIEFAFDRMQRTPNTVAAHQLIDLAQTQGKGDAVVDALFRTYFEEAGDIGDVAILQGIAERLAVKGWPEEKDMDKVREKEDRVRDLGINGVPTFIFDRKSGLSGAYPPDQLAQAIREAATK